MASSIQLVTCSKCGFTFHNNMGVDKCPRCRTWLKNNVTQSSAFSKKDIEDLNKILEFASSRK